MLRRQRKVEDGNYGCQLIDFSFSIFGPHRWERGRREEGAGCGQVWNNRTRIFLTGLGLHEDVCAC